MDYDTIKNKFLNKKFIFIYVIIFLMLSIFCGFIKFLGQWPVLLVITFLISYYVDNRNMDILSNFTSMKN